MKHILDLAFARDEPDAGELACALESFLTEHLTRARIWTGRDCDGIALTRIIERTEERSSIAGRVWLVGPQTQVPFWLVVERSESRAVRWCLHYGLDDAASRRDRDAVMIADSPDGIPWQASLLGGTGVSSGEGV